MTDWLQNIDFEDSLTLLNNFLSKCGIEWNNLNYNQIKSTNKIINEIRESLKKADILDLDQCKESIIDIINNKNYFQKLLEPMSMDCDYYSLSLPKSLLQIFLSISELNSFIIEIIIDKVCELSQNNSINDNELAMKYLDQLRWSISGELEDIVDRLLDLGYVSNNCVKKHIISMLPTVCYGRSNDSLAKKLYEWMNSDNSLIKSCLEAINQLDLKDRIDIELLIINLLDSAVMNTLPAMITFLMKCADKNNIITLVNKIRINISFDNLQTMFSSAVSSTPIEDPSLNSASHLINSIKANFQFNTNLHKSWLKSISTNPGEVRCQTFDLIVLLNMYDYKDVAASVIITIKSKVSKGLFTRDTVETLFKYHLGIIKPLYKTLFEIINIILNSIESYCCQFVKHVYEQCIKNENDDHNIYNIMDVLLTEITSKANCYVDNKVSVLSFLSQSCIHKLRPFYKQICELLSVSCKFSNSQVYNIYEILATLAFSGDDSDPNNIKQDITALIRRQLHNPDVFIRRNGAIGAITVMRQLAQCDFAEVLATDPWTKMWCSQADTESDQVSLNSSDQSLTANEKAVSTILKLLMSISEVYPQLSIVIFDELYRLIAMDEMKSVERNIRRIITNHFQDSYVVDRENTSAFTPIFGLIGTEYCDVAVMISQMKAGLVSVNISLPAHFRLLAFCEKKTHNNTLKDINALLGCPIILAKSITESQFLERITIINWLIEVVNAFSMDLTYNEIFHSTYTLRLKEIVSQMVAFEKDILEHHTIVKLPSAQIMTGSSLLAVSDVKACPGRKISIKSKQKPSKKRKVNVSNEIVVDDLFEEDTVEKEVSSERTSANKCKILKENLGLCYREFNLSVFTIMTDLVKLDLILSNKNNQSLQWRDLNFYFNDLWMKIKHRLRMSPVLLEGVFSQKSSVIYRYVDRLSLDDFVKEIIKLCPLFRKVLSSCIYVCKNTDIFEDEHSYCFNVMNLVLKSLSHIFNFLTVHEPEKKEALIANFMFSLVQDGTKIIVNDISEFLKELYSLKDNLPTVMIVSSYSALISNLLQYPSLSLDSFPISLQQLTLEFLSQKWNVNEFISLVDFKSSISSIYEICLSTLKDKWFEVLQGDILPEMIAIVKKDDITKESKYLCLNQSTLYGLFKLTLDYIIKNCKILSKKSINEKNTLEGLQMWEKIINIVRTLTNVVANYDEAHTMLAFIKFSRDLMKMIIKELMPVFDDMLRHENIQVMQLLKYIQEVTRFIQRVCIHCKGKKNLQVTSMVPQVRRYLEIFMYRVKKMMCINKCSGESLNILPLANKDLYGNRIESSDDEEKAVNEDDSIFPESDDETVLND